MYIDSQGSLSSGKMPPHAFERAGSVKSRTDALRHQQKKRMKRHATDLVQLKSYSTLHVLLVRCGASIKIVHIIKKGLLTYVELNAHWLLADMSITVDSKP